MIFSEGQKELCRKLNLDYDDVVAGLNELFKLDDIKAWINLAIQRAWDYARWIFSEEAKFTTATESEYYDYPDDFISDSIFILKVDGKSYDKKRFENYQKYLEDNPNGEDLVFSDYRRSYFINPNTFSAGKKIEIWGKKRATKLTGDDDLLPFSPDTDDEENSGNEAIIRIAYSIALASDKKKDPVRSAKEETSAYQMLEIIAKREREEQAQYQTKDRPFFDVPRFF